MSSTELLRVIAKAQSRFIANDDTADLFEELLKNLLSLTQSEYGFISELLHDPCGLPYLKCRALSSIAWSDEARAFYKIHQSADGPELRDLRTLLGSVLLTGREVISNSPSTDPRRGGLPEGHPPLESFLGLPIYNAGKMMGVIGIANRPGGYDHAFPAFLEPFTSTCASIILAHNNDRRRREVEEQLRTSTERLKAAQSIARFGYWEWDITTGELSWSDEIFKIFGFYTQEKATYERFLASVHPDDRDAVVNAVNEALMGKADYNIEHRIVLPGSEVRVVHELAQVRRSEDGTACAMFGTVQDITEQNRMEASLRESEGKYRTLFEDSMDVIFITDCDDGRILDINQAGVDLLGCDNKQGLLGRSITEFYNSPQDRERFKETVLRYGFVKDYEVPLKRDDGSKILASITATVVTGRNGRSTFQGILRDMTESAEIQRQLLHAQKMEAVGQLTGAVAHDFNNILTAVMGYANILTIKMDDDDPKRRYAESILSLAEKGASLTSGLLSFSRKDVVNIVPLALNMLVENLSGLLSKLLRHDIDFNLRLCADELVIMGDKGQIEQVIMNLVANARDAMPSGGVITVSTSLAAFDDDFAVKSSGYGEPGRFAMITVSDTGTGMDEVTRKKIFEPFYTTKPAGVGTGLGLSIVSGIVTRHGGSITVCSQPGFGTTFKVFIPLAPSENAQHREAREDEAALAGTETILVAEDDPDVSVITKTLIEEFGYGVIMASDGLAALEAFKARMGDIALVLLDVMMPGKNGKEVYDEIKSFSPGVKVIFTSGYPEDIVNSRMIFEDRLNFIGKPLAARDLLKKIRTVLDEDK